MIELPYHVTQLPNGARIASVEMPHMRSTSVGVWVGVGGRHEPADLSGVSHFIEHLLFKGTKRRTAHQISTAVEGIGGYLNAFTTEDHTCFYAKAGSQHFARIADVLGDMVLHSEFAPAEIEREREVIREEILMYRDQPAQQAQELLTATLWPGHPLGRALTGTVETVSRLTRAKLRAFQKEHYCGANTVITIAGRVPHVEAVAAIAPWASQIPCGKRPRHLRPAAHPRQPRIALHTHETEQMHLAMGFHAWGRSDERRFALKMLSVILGENMSSRLFQKLRERHGFCYSVASGMLALADTGALHISAGLDPSKLEPAIRMILREIDALAARGPTRTELRMARDYTIGQTLMGLESTTSQIMWMGESLLGYGTVLSPTDIEKRIHAVTPACVQRVAREVRTKGRLGIAIVGPLEDVKAVKGWL